MTEAGNGIRGAARGFFTEDLVDSGWDFELFHRKHLMLNRFSPPSFNDLRKIIKTTCLEFVENKDVRQRTHKNKSLC